MKKMNTCTIGILLLLIGMSITPVALKAQSETLQTQGGIQYGRPFTFVYERGNIVAPAKLFTLIYTNPLNPPDYLEMKLVDNIWRASFTVQDTAVKMVLVAFQGEDEFGLKNTKMLDNNEGEYWDLLVHNTSDEPVYGAYEARALSYTGVSSVRKQNINKAYTAIEQELKHYPENLAARNLYYTILLNREGYHRSAIRKIEKEIDKYLKNDPGKKEIMEFAIKGYRMIGKDDKAKDIENELIALNPQGNKAAEQRLSTIMKNQTVEDRIIALEAFLQEFPESHLIEFALSSLATAAIEADDSTRIESVGNLLLEKATTPGAASGLAGLAGVLAEKNYKLALAATFADKAVSLVNSAKISTRPPDVSQDEWQYRLSTTEARYRDILGWTLVRQGKYNEGLAELKEAVKGTSQPGVFYHLAAALEKTGSNEDAILNYARAAAYGGEIGSLAQESLEVLWSAAGRNPSDIDAFLIQQETWIRDNYTQKVLSRRNVYEAPDFDLETTKGGWVRLSDQKGGPVLLFFWASWSQSSWQMLKEIHKLSKDYGEDVLFLTIATDNDDDTIYDYVRKKRIFLPVLFNDGTDYSYKVKGVPTIFLIDAKGNVQFEHKGFRPEIIDMLIIEMEDLLKSGG